MNIKKLFIISGPSGAGEDSIIKGLSARMHVHTAITTVTRVPRTDESEGHPYYFVSKEVFKEKIANNDFAEWAQHYNDHYYGVTHEELHRVTHAGDVGLWKMDYKGVIAAKKMFPEIVAIFIMADSLTILEKRIREREGATEAYVRERMEYTKEWLEHVEIYDYTVINKQDHLENAIVDVESIIRHYNV